MTSKHIADQIETIRIAAEKACASKEAALNFLMNAGIIPKEEQVTSLNDSKEIPSVSTDLTNGELKK